MTHNVILGIGQTHNASVCLLVDGHLTACASEERFNRQKNTTAFPVEAARYVLQESCVEPGEVDSVVHSYRHPVPGFSLGNERVASAATRSMRIAQRFANRVVAYYPPTESILRSAYRGLSGVMQNGYEERFRTEISRTLGVDRSRVHLEDHHQCHAYAGYAFYVDEHTWDRPALVFTLDAEGDNKCATVSIAHRGELTTLATTQGGQSIGVLYGAITEWLGMRMNEHEYKVMGLAPYAPLVLAEQARMLLEPLVWVEDQEFRTSCGSGAFSHVLRRRLQGQRFDAVAAGIQRLLEDRVVEWVRSSVQQTGITEVVLSGGVFMNVKANMAIMEMPEITNVTVCPSGADESTPIGAAFGEYCRRAGSGAASGRIVDDLYLGPAFQDRYVQEALARHDAATRYQVTKLTSENEAEVVAGLLAEGEVVARFAGRMEFGARALGNRSILADPSRREVVRVINDQIKGRDFWMPFACTVLAGAADRYLQNPKGVQAPYMAMAFHTRADQRESVVAGTHPYDHTARPQVLERHDNPRYHDLIQAFERRTGIGALLNTSFNLHGEPVVCTPDDTLDVFDRSGLTTLQLEGWLVRKGASF